jgi:hypothetical protein
VGAAVRRAIGREFPSADDGGQMRLVARVVERYINKGILPTDAAQPGVTFRGLEQKLETRFAFTCAGREMRVNFTGTADRVDSLPGGVLRVVDYKTGRIGAGALMMEFRDVDSLFHGEARGAGSAAVQTLLYAMMLSRSTDSDAQPAIYAVRHMHEKGYSPLLLDRTTGFSVMRYSDYAATFEGALASALGGLFDPTVPFSQCEDEVQCRYCDFRHICVRGFR